MILNTAVYLIASAWILIVCVRALYLMNKHSDHMRRVAFSLMACGSVVSFLEAWEMLYPNISATMMASGAAILFLLGARETRIGYQNPAHVSNRK